MAKRRKTPIKLQPLPERRGPLAADDFTDEIIGYFASDEHYDVLTGLTADRISAVLVGKQFIQPAEAEGQEDWKIWITAPVAAWLANDAGHSELAAALLRILMRRDDISWKQEVSVSLAGHVPDGHLPLWMLAGSEDMVIEAGQSLGMEGVDWMGQSVDRVPWLDVLLPGIRNAGWVMGYSFFSDYPGITHPCLTDLTQMIPRWVVALGTVRHGGGLPVLYDAAAHGEVWNPFVPPAKVPEPEETSPADQVQSAQADEIWMIGRDHIWLIGRVMTAVGLVKDTNGLKDANTMLEDWLNHPAAAGLLPEQLLPDREMAGRPPQQPEAQTELNV